MIDAAKLHAVEELAERAVEVGTPPQSVGVPADLFLELLEMAGLRSVANKPPIIADGTRSEGVPGYCGYCRRSLGGSGDARIAYWLGGQPYHAQCYPTVVAAEETARQVRNTDIDAAMDRVKGRRLPQ